MGRNGPAGRTRTAISSLVLLLSSALLASVGVGSASASEPYESARVPADQDESTPPSHEHEFHRHHIALMLGAMTPLTEVGDTSFALGGDYVFHFTRYLGAGIGGDYVAGKHERAGVIALAFVVTPFHNLHFSVGPGAEIVSHGESNGHSSTTVHFLMGVGAAYDIHVGPLILAPTVFLDFVGETKTNLTYGVSVGTGF